MRPMADLSSPLAFEDVPLDKARRISHGPGMDPLLTQTPTEKCHSLDNAADRMTLLAGTIPTTLKTRIIRVAAALGMPVTIRTVPGASSSGARLCPCASTP